MLGWEAEDHCRVWGKDHTPGKGGAELRGRAELGRPKGWRLPEARLGGYRARSIHLLLLEGMKGKKEGRKEREEQGRKEKRRKKIQNKKTK